MAPTLGREYSGFRGEYLSLDWAELEALCVDGEVTPRPNGVNSEGSNWHKLNPGFAHVACVATIHQPLDHLLARH